MGKVVNFNSKSGSAPRRRSTTFLGILAPIMIVGFGLGFQTSGLTLFGYQSASPNACDIKGNINPSTGTYIYHLPGQKYYAVTTINPRYGERMFCSEWDAMLAGWRRSKV